MIVDKLYESVAKKGVVCVGLDTDISYVPEYLQKEAGSAGEAVFLFNKAIIDATEDVAGCYKEWKLTAKHWLISEKKSSFPLRILNGAILPKPPKCMRKGISKGILRRTL